MPGVFQDFPAPVVRNAGAERELTMMRWGSHDLPHSLGQACRGVASTSAGRLFFKPKKGMTFK
jgi:hypothetical protein